MIDGEQYLMRGMRVAPMHKPDIEQRVQFFCDIFGLSKKTKSFAHVFEKLVLYGITLEIIDDDEWQKITFDLTVGHCDPSDLTISIPDRIYTLACKGDRSSLSVMFHEIGHLLLMHKPLLHYSVTNPDCSEDSEWQADTFSELVLKTIGFKIEQLVFEFHM